MVTFKINIKIYCQFIKHFLGYSCQLLTDEMIDVFIVDGFSKSEVEHQLKKFKESIQIVNTFHPAGI